MFRHKLSELRSNSFLRSVSVLVSGNVVGQAILAVALPVATRLYSPADFAVLAVFTGVLSILSVAACLRFELAIALPERETDALNVLGLAILIALLFAAVVAVPAIAVPVQLAELLNRPDLAVWLWMLSPALLLAGCHSALQFWFVRVKSFRPIAGARIGQSCAVVGTQITLGSLGIAPAGLLIGQVFNSGIGCLSLGYRLIRTQRHQLSSIHWVRMLSLIHI